MSNNHSNDPQVSQYLTLNLGKEEYAVDILSVREIRGWTPVTRIPQAPTYLLGVLNLRGAVVPVLDLRMRFGLEQVEYNANTVTVIITIENRLFGVVADAVSDVLDVSPSDIRAVPDMGASVDTQYLKGLTALGERMVLLLDADKLLLAQDAEMLDTALHATNDIEVAA